ncbi:MAG: DNA polymerase I [Muribaculaceae bacterium]|nr:DNA polymerase I [Muribaculaceae bacterium]
MEEKKLFLLDAYALIYRAYYALIRAPRVTSKGLNTSAIFGFCNTLDEILRKENPSHIAVCFDPPHGITFRHEAYPEYKAQRDAQPEDITKSVPYIKRIIEAYNIPVVEVAGFEADDVIGTLAKRAESEGYTTYMMTPDKDYGQLVTDRILMYRPASKGREYEIRGPREVCERYGISDTIQVIDLLALEGDASDNIPGCPGVGEKTAAKLIAEWGSVENLIDHIADLKGALQRKVADNVEQIKFSKFLATIKTDVPVDVTIDSLVRQPENVAALRDLYRELEFKTFLSRLGASSAPAEPQSAPKSADNSMGSLFDIPDADEPSADTTAMQPSGVSTVTVDTVTDLAAIGSLVARCAGCTTGLSVHADGPEAMSAVLRGIALATEAAKATYIPLPDNDGSRSELLSVLEPLFTSPSTRLVSLDIKRDMLLLRRLGINLTAPYDDVAIAHYLIEPEKRHRLSDLAMQYLGYMTADYANDNATRRQNVPLTPVNVGEQAALVLPIHDLLGRQLSEQGLDNLYRDIELPMACVLADMEWTGVRIDTAELNNMSVKLTEQVTALEQQVYELAGKQFNISSPMQVGEVLFEDLKIDPNAKRTKRGAYSTTEEILEKYRSVHPIVGLILEIRGLRKLLATYINALPELINRTTGKIHTTYNQTVTATGRLSSTNPNLQNIPIRTDLGREIRRAFIPDEGDLMLSADYSQIELRLMADMSGDPDMVEAFRSGADIHRATAARIYHKAFDDVTDTERRHAKTANFGIIYGISAFGLSERLSIPRAEAKMLIDGYFATYPHIRDYIDDCIAKAREQGYVTTVMGRKRMLPDINSRNAVVRGYAERNAVNAPLQGSAADIIKRAMIDIHRAIRREGLKSTMILQVHDELVFNVKPDELPRLQQLVTELMENAYQGRVRLEVSSGVASNWLEAH